MESEYERFYMLVEKSLEGTLDQAESQELEEIIKNDKEMKELFLSLRHQHANLSLDPRISGPTPIGLGIDKGIGQPLVSETTKIKSMEKWWYAAAAVCLSFGLWAILQSMVINRPSYIATIENTEACVWEGGSLPTQKGSQLNSGVLRLIKGFASVRFESGALIKLEGPAELKLIDEMNCQLLNGTMMADVPPSAHLFKVTTPKAEVVDLGTSFTLNVNRNGDSQVNVIEGEVEARALDSKEIHRLTQGQGGRVLDKTNLLALDTIDVELNRAIGKSGLEDQYSVRIGTDDGRGDDAYIPSMDHENVSDTLLLVKNGAGSRTMFHRHAYLKFDLSIIPEGELKNATLQLQFLPTGFGTGMELPDSEFSVYYLKESGLDNWEYPDITWENAPANIEREFDLTKVTKLGSFVVKRGRENGRYDINGDALKNIVLNDDNKVCTMIVVRDTVGNNSANDSLVHGIASRRHPTAQPPTLKLDIQSPHSF